MGMERGGFGWREKKGQVRRPDEKGLVTTYGAGEQAQRALVENWVLERKKNEVN